jgi:hypothetical protein
MAKQAHTTLRQQGGLDEGHLYASAGVHTSRLANAFDF